MLNETEFLHILSQYSHIVIFGTGMVGQLVYERLKSKKLLYKIKAYTQTNVYKNQKFNDIDLKPLTELKQYAESACIVIAALPNLHDEIEKEILCHGYLNIFKITKDIYDDMSNKYIEDFKTNHSVIQEKIDIMFLSSDNDSTSGAFLCMAELNQKLNLQKISSLVVLPVYGDGEKILKKLNVDYTYVLSKHWGVKEAELNQKNILADNNAAIKELSNMIKKYHIKIVHNNTSYTYVGALAAYECKIPVVWHMREYMIVQGYDFYNLEYSKKIMQKANAIIFVSQFMAACYNDFKFKNSFMVSDGIDIDRFYLDRDILNTEEIHIVTIGAVTAQKGQLDLINAAVLLKEQLRFKIDIVGKIEKDYLKILLEVIEKNHISDQICFWGKQEQPELFYKKNDIVVVCSDKDSFGRVTAEAQAAGCLVIGANTGATTELIANYKTGLLYERGDYEQLATQISYAAEHRNISRNISKAGQEYICRKYSSHDNARKILTIYQNILTARGEKL